MSCKGLDSMVHDCLGVELAAEGLDEVAGASRSKCCRVTTSRDEGPGRAADPGSRMESRRNLAETPSGR